MHTSHLIAFILAAGEGTRLRPITLSRPKPLVKVCDLPLIEYSFQALRRVGIRKFAINAYYLADQIEAYLLDRKLRFKDETHIFVRETTLMGTGGGIAGLYRAVLDYDPQLDFEALIVNADAFFHFDLQRLIDAHFKGKHEATLALRKTSASDPFGRIGTDQNGKIVRIAEVEGIDVQDECGLSAYLGVQIVSQSVLARLKLNFSDIFRTAHRECLNLKSHRIYGSEVMQNTKHNFWFDVGTPMHLLQAHAWVSDWLDTLNNSDSISDSISDQSMGIALGGIDLPNFKEMHSGLRIFQESLSIDHPVEMIGKWTFKNVWVGANCQLRLINLTADQTFHLESIVLMDHCKKTIDQSLRQMIFVGNEIELKVEV
jgi:NDP-sugar pyrophosphorylase family protein